jgi:hypothetical protein
VDGVAGERLVFKRRGESDEPPSPLGKKRILFVMDISGSMYRFNGKALLGPIMRWSQVLSLM